MRSVDGETAGGEVTALVRARDFGAVSHTRPSRYNGRSCSATERVLSLTMSPVCKVDLRSISIT